LSLYILLIANLDTINPEYGSNFEVQTNNYMYISQVSVC